jgi:hypothetical protein
VEKLTDNEFYESGMEILRQEAIKHCETTPIVLMKKQASI